MCMIAAPAHAYQIQAEDIDTLFVQIEIYLVSRMR